MRKKKNKSPLPCGENKRPQIVHENAQFLERLVDELRVKLNALLP
jgi:hypothetical protein